MRKRLLSALLCLCMVIVTLPIPIAGAINDEIILQSGKDARGTGWVWDGDSRVLTALGLDEQLMSVDTILFPDNSTIVLKGDNAWTLKTVSCGNLCITGSGSLTLSTIVSTGNICLESGNVHVDKISANDITITGGILISVGNGTKMVASNLILSAGAVDIKGPIIISDMVKITGGFLHVSSSEDSGAIQCNRFENDGGIVDIYTSNGAVGIDANTSSFTSGVTLLDCRGYLQETAISGTVQLQNQQKVFDLANDGTITSLNDDGTLNSAMGYVVVADSAYIYSYWEPVTVTETTLKNVFIQGNDMLHPNSDIVIPTGTASYINGYSSINQSVKVNGTFVSNQAFTCNGISIFNAGTKAASGLDVNGNLNVSGGNLSIRASASSVDMFVKAQTLTQTTGNITIDGSGVELTGSGSNYISGGTLTVDAGSLSENVYALKSNGGLVVASSADISLNAGLASLAYSGSEIQISDRHIKGRIYRGGVLDEVAYSFALNGYQTEEGDAVAVLYIGNWDITEVTPPTETDPEVTVEEVTLTTDVADDISSEDRSALNAVLSKAAITGMKDVLNETSVNKIVQMSGVSTTGVDEIKVQLKAALTVTAADLDKGTISFEVAPTAEVTAGSETKTVSVDNSYLNGKNITVKLPIPAGFNPKEILHISKEKPIEQYLLNNGFTVADGTAVLYIDHFSELRMNESQTTVAKIEGSDTGYFSLQSAIDAAQSDARINLYNNSDDTVLKVANKSLTINCNTYQLRSDVDWQLTNCTKSETTDEQGHKVIVITYAGGGSSSSGGGGSASGKPSASVSGSGGKVAVASNGVVTITPDQGYQISKITVNGKEVNIPANGKLTGLGKDDKVVVTFEKIPEEKPGTSTTPFTDVAKNAWYADAVQYVYENGIMDGTSAASFSPNATTTRGMIVTMLHRLEDTPPAASSGFTDVAVGAWYADAVAWAAKNGVVNGVSAASFAPNTAITREQLAAILYRYAQLKGYSVSVSGNLSGYADASQISEYAVAAMQWANAAGLITGNTANTLNPRGHATRAEVATILMRFVEKMG